MITGAESLVGDRYQVGDTLGFGGMSEVHRGRDLRLGRDVAIKVLRADLARDPSFQARFRREAQNAASLNHPAIVAVYDTGETTGEAGTVPYIVMEYVDGDTLRDVLKKEGPLPPRRAMEIVADICAALDFSHRHGIVHRDIKPANVMLNRAGAVKVMDFGIARAVADGQATMTATAAVIGTAQYLSPEQARGEAVDARSDVYATGCVLYELLCGAPPFTGDSPVAVAYQHVREAPRPPSETKPGLPKEMDAIVLKALNKNPLNRYQTAAEMRSDLVRALSGQAVQADTSTDANRDFSAPTGSAVPPLLAPPTRMLTDQVDPPEEVDGSRPVWGFVGIGVLCAALLAGAIWLTLQVLTAPPPTPLIAVPDLSGMTLEQATTQLQEAGLSLGDVTRVESADTMTGKVVGQRPSNHTEVSRDAPVDLKIGRGLSAASVPDVLGMTPAAAKNAIIAAHLVYAEVRQPSSDPDKGKVFAQDPSPQTQAAPKSTVTVTVGTGLTMVTVPKGVIGKNLDQATAVLKKAKLTVVTEVGDGVEPPNQVIRMDQRAGQKLPEGTPVTLTVSNNSLMIMPSLQNQTGEQAVATLRAQGWAGDAGTLASTEQATTTQAQVGAVLAQQPAAGSAVRKIGTPVSVAIGARGITMPDLIGKTQRQASTLLDRAGATNVTFADAGTPPRGKANRVESQSIPAGTAVTADTAIIVSVYGG